MARQKRQHLTPRKDGRFKAVYRGIQFMGATEAEALEKRQAYIEAEIRGELLNRDGISVFSYASEWLPVHKASVAKNTYNAYAAYMNKLVDKIGRTPIKDVTPSDIKSVFNDYLGMSDSSIRKARMLYVALWDCAIEDGVARSNPCRSKAAKPHHGTQGSHRALSREEDDIILNCESAFRIPALLMRYAGLRRGEVMDFDVDRDVDFENNIIIVSRAVHFEGNSGVVGDPKTEAGKRSIPLLDVLRAELQGRHGPVCPMANVRTMTSSAWRSMWSSYIGQLETYVNGCQKRWFHRTREWKSEHPEQWEQYASLKRRNPVAAEQLRLKDWKSVNVRPHDLRHSYATMLRDAGVDAKLAIRWMGHSDEKMILRIYDHPSERRVQSAIRSLNSIVKGASGGAADSGERCE